jgi:hypothetical protein
VRGRNADARVVIQTGKCALGVALESLKPTRICVCVCVCLFCVRTAKFGCKLAVLERIGEHFRRSDSPENFSVLSSFTIPPLVFIALQVRQSTLFSVHLSTVES